MFKNLTLLNLMYEETSNIQTFTYFKGKVNVDQMIKFVGLFLCLLSEIQYGSHHRTWVPYVKKSNVTSVMEDESLMYICMFNLVEILYTIRSTRCVLCQLEHSRTIIVKDSLTYNLWELHSIRRLTYIQSNLYCKRSPLGQSKSGFLR